MAARLSIEFAMASNPEPQGSIRQVPIGRRCSACGLARMGLTSDNPDLNHWRRDVALLARQAMGDQRPWRGPVYAELIFVVPRPQRMPPGRADYPITKPDLDKLERAIYDACAGHLGGKQVKGQPHLGLVYVDDAQIVEHHNRKRYPTAADEVPGVIVRLRALVPELEGIQEEMFA